MIRLHNAASFMRRLFSAIRSRRHGVAPVDISPEMAEVASAIRARQAGGHKPALRQLHKISSLSQPQALVRIHALESDGIVHIESNLGDAFKATITVTEKSLRRLDLGVA